MPPPYGGHHNNTSSPQQASTRTDGQTTRKHNASSPVYGTGGEHIANASYCTCTEKVGEFVGADVAVVLAVVEEVRENALSTAVAQRVAFRTRPGGCTVNTRRTRNVSTQVSSVPK